jgi:hypothetical protein
MKVKKFSFFWSPPSQLKELQSSCQEQGKQKKNKNNSESHWNGTLQTNHQPHEHGAAAAESYVCCVLSIYFY